MRLWKLRRLTNEEDSLHTFWDNTYNEDNTTTLSFCKLERDNRTHTTSHIRSPNSLTLALGCGTPLQDASRVDRVCGEQNLHYLLSGKGMGANLLA